MRKFMKYLWLGLGLLWASVAVGQPVFDPVVELDFDDPEAWAMKYFASVSLLTSLGPIEPIESGAVILGFEGLYVPELDQEQRTVGFGGFKEEDLNRSAAWGRLRLGLGLPGDFTLTLGWVPPVELDGVQANLVSVSLARPLISRDSWGLGLRIYGQRGEVDGDFTCEEGGDHVFPPGSADNPFGCEAPSDDTVTLDYVGAQWVAHRRFSGPRSPVIYAGIAWSRMDLEFQVRAQTFGFSDQSRLLADGDTWALTVGGSWTLSESLTVGTEAFYSDLDVVRPGRDRESDPLVNARFMLSYRIR